MRLAKTSSDFFGSILGAALTSGLLIGCGGCGDEPAGTPAGGEAAAPGDAGARKDDAAPAAAATFTVDPATAATISGKVTFSGTPPPTPPPINTGADANCAALHKDKPLFPEEVVLNDNKTVRWVFVYVSKGLEGKAFPAPAEAVVFDQKGCHYEPHVFGAQVGQKVTIRNSDATNHNVHMFPKGRTEINNGMPTQGMEIPVKFTKPETAMKIKCEVHPWMAAWGFVLTHPYFGVTDGQGSFKISNLPPGKYTLTAWHEKFGKQDKEVEIAAKDAKTFDFEFKN